MAEKEREKKENVWAPMVIKISDEKTGKERA